MNLSISPREQAAHADRSPRFAPRPQAGPGAFAPSARADARTQSRIGAAMAVQVRTEQGERPGCIRNLSSRGVMISMARPPRRGEFVEIATGSHSLVGQVRWASDSRAGIVLQEAIDVGAVLSGESGPRAALRKPARKTICAPAVIHSPRDSHIVARQLQFAAMIAFGAVAALMIALSVNDLLTEVVNQVRAGLPG